METEYTIKQCQGAIAAARALQVGKRGNLRDYYERLERMWEARLEEARAIAHCSEVL